MRAEWYEEYRMVPSMEAEYEEFMAGLRFIQTLERFRIMDVRPCYRASPYDYMKIWVDGKYYDEEISSWMKRFGGRSERV